MTATVLAYGFRPFFLLAPLAGGVAVLPLPMIWLGLADMWGDLSIGAWHGHEQVFGFLSAALAGFLLTALPSWTGTPPVTGRNLAGLCLLWLVGRVAFWLDPLLPPALVAAADILFLPALLVAVVPVLRRPGPRPWEFVAALAALAAINAVFHLGRLGVVEVTPERAATTALNLFQVLIALALGRILPVVLRSALVETGRAPQVRLMPGRRHLAVTTLVLFTVAEAVAPGHAVTGWIALAAACAQVDRMRECHLAGALRRPQAALFYAAQGWMALGLALLGLSALGMPVNPAAARHALGLGAGTTTALTVMSVVSLRHTARPFPLPAATWGPAALVSVATALRMAVPELAPETMAAAGVTIPMLLWLTAFGLWLRTFSPWLLRPRVDGCPG